jgi:hypothetical protein
MITDVNDCFWQKTEGSIGGKMSASLSILLDKTLFSAVLIQYNSTAVTQKFASCSLYRPLPLIIIQYRRTDHTNARLAN